jgi:nitrate/TMAO reductase-like tetraheme cytochrome c subunit
VGGREPGRRPGRGKPLPARIWIITAVTGALLIGALAVIVQYTETAPFCRTCHEMEPYYQAWARGGHPKATCVDCHIDPGVVAHAAHKFVALREVWDHLTTSPVFPGQAVDMPNSRCARCHPIVTMNSASRFDHALHERQGQCVVCHPTVGHDVTLAALGAEGILAPGASVVASSGPLGRGAPLAGHVTVECQRCHDMTKTSCSTCHRATHEPRGECGSCHKPAATWTFAHPRTRHDYRSIPCAKCHTNGYATYSCTCHGTNSPKGD